MRLLRVSDFQLEEILLDRKPQYGVLSHTWGKEEVTLQDMKFNFFACRQKVGWKKIQATCQQAKVDQLHYVWIDTCCIDKSSSAELSEAINSMFTWYKNAAKCYAYLMDVEKPFLASVPLYTDIRQSRWWSRGWTLQELIAPTNVAFYDGSWRKIGTKHDFAKDIEAHTGIDAGILRGTKLLGEVSIARRMYWASSRNTTRVEDIAYCLLGIFDVNMPLIYGEGTKAFIRLQEEIIRTSDDESIFAWAAYTSEVSIIWRSEKSRIQGTGVLAPSPRHFSTSENIVPLKSSDLATSPFSMTNKGLSIESYVRDEGESIRALLNCSHSADVLDRVEILLLPVSSLPGAGQECVRHFATNQSKAEGVFQIRRLYIRQRQVEQFMSLHPSKDHVLCFSPLTSLSAKTRRCAELKGIVIFESPDQWYLDAEAGWKRLQLTLGRNYIGLRLAVFLELEELRETGFMLALLLGRDFRQPSNFHLGSDIVDMRTRSILISQDDKDPSTGSEPLRDEATAKWLCEIYEEDAKGSPPAEAIRVKHGFNAHYYISVHRKSSEESRGAIDLELKAEMVKTLPGQAHVYDIKYDI